MIHCSYVQVAELPGPWGAIPIPLAQSAGRVRMPTRPRRSLCHEATSYVDVETIIMDFSQDAKMQKAAPRMSVLASTNGEATILVCYREGMAIRFKAGNAR